MNKQFSTPKEFSDYSVKLFTKREVTKRDFVDLCLLATQLIDNNWEHRQGIAYHIAGALSYRNIREDSLLSEIGSLFGTLELPDAHIAKDEAEVRKIWKEAKKLVLEANGLF